MQLAGGLALAWVHSLTTARRLILSDGPVLIQLVPSLSSPVIVKSLQNVAAIAVLRRIYINHAWQSGGQYQTVRWAKHKSLPVVKQAWAGKRLRAGELLFGLWTKFGRAV